MLAAYDYESLAVTLHSLQHTVSSTEHIVVVLNGRSLSALADLTERVARTWAQSNPRFRHVVRPLCCGGTAYAAITEVVAHYPLLQEVAYICKIDDDLIPVKPGWVDRLAKAYELKAAHGKAGFTTGFINNNCWGFRELLPIFGKAEEYHRAFDYYHATGLSSQRINPPGTIDVGDHGTIWQNPYIAWWMHHWTSLDPEGFVHKTKGLPPREIGADTYFSIGCVYLHKSLWLEMNQPQYRSTFDEVLLHEHCRRLGLQKWALMDEPMIHLYFRSHRRVNAALIEKLLPVLARHFNDESFHELPRLTREDLLLQITEQLTDLQGKTGYLYRKISSLSFVQRWKEKKRRVPSFHNGCTLPAKGRVILAATQSLPYSPNPGGL